MTSFQSMNVSCGPTRRRCPRPRLARARWPHGRHLDVADAVADADAASSKPGRLALAATAALLLGCSITSSLAGTPSTAARGSFALMAHDLPFLAHGPRVDDAVAPADAALQGAAAQARIEWESTRLAARRASETGDIASAQAQSARALELATRRSEPDWQLASHADRALYGALDGDARLAHDELARAKSLAPLARDVPAFELLEFAAVIHASLAQDALAADDIRAGLAASATAHDPRAQIFLLLMNARLALARGDVMQASSDITSAVAMRGGRMRETAEESMALDRSLLDIATGRGPAGAAQLESLLAALAGDGDAALEVDALDAVGVALARLGQVEGARVLDARARALERAAASGEALQPRNLRSYAHEVPSKLVFERRVNGMRPASDRSDSDSLERFAPWIAAGSAAAIALLIAMIGSRRRRVARQMAELIARQRAARQAPSAQPDIAIAPLPAIVVAWFDSEPQQDAEVSRQAATAK